MNEEQKKESGSIPKMPDFLIIGTAKGGTSALYKYLKEHPNVVPANTTEVHFFNVHFDKGIEWYRDQFPLLKSNDPNMITGEATPYYLVHSMIPPRVFDAMPHVKLIVLLRNPVDRAYSKYQMGVRGGRRYKKTNDGTLLTFEEAIEIEMNQGDPKNRLLGRGIYVDQLQNWMSWFPREQFLIIKSEEMYQDPASIYQQVTDFLELPRFTLETYPYFNQYKHKYQTMNQGTRKKLIDYFKPHNKRLYEFLGRNFDWDQ